MPNKTILILFFVVAAIFALINITGFDLRIKNFFYNFSSPVQKIFWGAGETLAKFFEEEFKESELRNELEYLKDQNQELLGRLISLSQIEKENEKLRAALNIGMEDEFSLILAEVVGKDITSDSILINKGKKEGLLEGYPVLTEKKALVGKIGEVMDNFSEVILISSKESSFDGEILDKEIKGIVKGRGGLGANLDLIPKEDNLALGDIVITSSLGGVFPQGFLVGTVHQVRNSDQESFNVADLSPAVELNDLRTVFIVTNFND